MNTHNPTGFLLPDETFTPWKTYSETWPVALDSNEVRKVTWTHDEIEEISKRFATVEYWGNKIDYWKLFKGNADQDTLIHSWLVIISGLPIPVRHGCVHVIRQHFSKRISENEFKQDGSEDSFLNQIIREPCLPLSNVLTDVKSDFINRLIHPQDLINGTAVDVFGPIDWLALTDCPTDPLDLLFGPTDEDRQHDDLQWAETSPNHRLICMKDALGEQCAQWRKQLLDITPKAFANPKAYTLLREDFELAKYMNLIRKKREFF